MRQDMERRIYPIVSVVVVVFFVFVIWLEQIENIDVDIFVWIEKSLEAIVDVTCW